ncbi:MAG: hypothetical protein GC154_16875 [bacterium]|nr:hypothetical protein [bacterium]
MNPSAPSIGRARAALVFGSGEQTRAVLTGVIATTSEYDPERPVWLGEIANFDERCRSHILETILPILNRLLFLMGISPRTFSLSIANLGAASLMDRGLTVTGFSADVPLFLAMLSAALGITIPRDAVVTGHVASLEGGLAPVRSIPEKIQAAVDDEGVQRFLYPPSEEDASIAALTPNEQRRMEEAVIHARRFIQCHPVRDLAEVVEQLIPEDEIILSSLRCGFWKQEYTPPADDSSCTRLLQFLLTGHERRFWNALETLFIANRFRDAKRLVSARIEIEAQHETYPSGFGHRLHHLLHALPPSLSRSIEPPLAAVSDCIRMAQYAGADQAGDVPVLLKANALDILPAHSLSPRGEVEPGDALSEMVERVESVMHQLSEASLAREIGSAIDHARAVFLLESPLVETSDEFHRLLTAFYLHLMRHACGQVECADPGHAASEAHALLERAYAERGGTKAALLEGREGAHGGMRLVLDVMTDRFKREEKEKYMNRVLGEILDPLDWDGKVAFTAAFLDRIRSLLPEELQTASPKQYAHHYARLVRLYVQCKDRFTNVIQSL